MLWPPAQWQAVGSCDCIPQAGGTQWRKEQCHHQHCSGRMASALSWLSWVVPASSGSHQDAGMGLGSGHHLPLAWQGPGWAGGCQCLCFLGRDKKRWLLGSWSGVRQVPGRWSCPGGRRWIWNRRSLQGPHTSPAAELLLLTTDGLSPCPLKDKRERLKLALPL